MSEPVRRADPRWEAAADEHQVALASFLESAERVPASAWTRPRAPGKWSPAQITEHVSLAYEAVLGELAGGPPMAARMAPWRQALLRWILLPHMLFHRSFPVRAPAPRETRPGDGPADRRAALERLRALGERLEPELDRARRAGGHGITHPYFGTIPPLKALRFGAVHLEHHRRQLDEVAGAARR